MRLEGSKLSYIPLEASRVAVRPTERSFDYTIVPQLLSRAGEVRQRLIGQGGLVKIYDKSRPGYGTGIVFNMDGVGKVIATAAHVLESAQDPAISTYDDRDMGITKVCMMKDSNRGLDLAIVLPDGQLTDTPFTIGSSPNGELGFIAGFQGKRSADNPAVLPAYLTAHTYRGEYWGVVTGFADGSDQQNPHGLLMEGTSGGPVITQNNHVAGVIFANSKSLPWEGAFGVEHYARLIILNGPAGPYSIGTAITSQDLTRALGIARTHFLPRRGFFR